MLSSLFHANYQYFEVFQTDLLLSIKSWIIRNQSFLSHFLAKAAENDVNLKSIRYPRIIRDLSKRGYRDSYKLSKLLPVIPLLNFMQMSSKFELQIRGTDDPLRVILGIDLFNPYLWIVDKKSTNREYGGASFADKKSTWIFF